MNTIEHQAHAGSQALPLARNQAAAGDGVFFRTPALWWYVEDEFLPGWHARARGRAGAAAGARALRIWTAAADGGEQAYSVAMACLEFQRSHPAFRFAIEATGASAQALQAAQEGVYAAHAVARFEASRPALAGRYLQGGQAGFRVTPALRAQVGFSVHDLLDAASGVDRYDLVMLGNVLSAYAPAQQQRILAQVRRAMRPGAKLVLGDQGAIARLDTAFAFEQAHVYHIDDAPA